MFPGEKSFQLLRKVGENYPLQKTRFVIALCLKSPERSQAVLPFFAKAEYGVGF
jgi:hypothetical protein